MEVPPLPEEKVWQIMSDTEAVGKQKKIRNPQGTEPKNHITSGKNRKDISGGFQHW